MDISDLPAFFQNKKRSRLVTLTFLTSALPLTPSNALVIGFLISLKLLFSVFFLDKPFGVCLSQINQKIENYVT